MQIFPIAIVAAFLATNVNAGCFHGGTTAAAANINPNMAIICANLIGTFVKGETRFMCAMDSAGIEWDFTLKFLGGTATGSIASPACITGMKLQTACTHGGNQVDPTGLWEFIADPNVGSCYSNTYKMF